MHGRLQVIGLQTVRDRTPCSRKRREGSISWALGQRSKLVCGKPSVVQNSFLYLSVPTETKPMRTRGLRPVCV